MRIGLIELHVDLRRRPASEVRAAIVANPRARERLVRTALDEAREKRCGVVLFPGWTLVTHRPHALPSWLRAASAGRTIICECIPPRSARPKTGGKVGNDPMFDGWFHVVRDGTSVLQPVKQVLSEAHHVARYGSELARELGRSDARRWREGGVRAIFMACGEVNIVSGGGPSEASWRRTDLSDPTRDGARLVLNPAHTPSSPQAMRDKREFLSRGGGWLMTTANVYTADRSRYRAADAWHDGEAANHLEGPNELARDRGYAVHVATI